MINNNIVYYIGRAKKILNEELDAQPICFKGKLGQKEKLKIVPGWQERLKEYVDKLIEEIEKH